MFSARHLDCCKGQHSFLPQATARQSPPCATEIQLTKPAIVFESLQQEELFAPHRSHRLEPPSSRRQGGTTQPTYIHEAERKKDAQYVAVAPQEDRLQPAP